MISDEVINQAQILWNYLKLGQPLQKAGCLLVMGSHDLRVAEYGAKLFLEGWAPLMVCSGGLGNFTKEVWDEAEAVKFGRVAEKIGVPREKILIESQSTNTGENVLFTREVLGKKSIHPDSMLLVHKPYMERRALATFQALWPDMPVRVSSPNLSLLDYPNRDIPMEDLLNIMVGDFQRIMVYPQKGFQVVQPVPDQVMDAYLYLLGEGFTRHLLAEEM
jgi:uncharacterized SAM-binding protein YcdF (DUF218 family)